MIVLVTIVSVTVISVHEVIVGSNDRVVGCSASRTQPVHPVGAGVEVFAVISDVALTVLKELEWVEELLLVPVKVVVALDEEMDVSSDVVVDDDGELEDPVLLWSSGEGYGGTEPVHVDEVEDEDDDIDEEFTNLSVLYRRIYMQRHTICMLLAILKIHRSW